MGVASNEEEEKWNVSQRVSSSGALGVSPNIGLKMSAGRNIVTCLFIHHYVYGDTRGLASGDL